MAKIIFKVLFGIIKTVLNVILLPVNLIISNLFPSVSSLISTFNSVLTTISGSGIAYFANFLPPMTKTIILYYLSILIVFYTISLSIHGFIKVFTIIKKIKFW